MRNEFRPRIRSVQRQKLRTWLRADMPTPAPTLPLALALIDATTNTKQTVASLQLRMILLALSYEKKTPIIEIERKILASYVGTARVTQLDDLLARCSCTWTLNATETTKAKTVEAALIASWTASGDQLAITLSDETFALLNDPTGSGGGYAHVCLGRMRDATNVNAAAFIPYVSYRDSILNARQPIVGHVRREVEFELDADDFRKLVLASERATGRELRRIASELVTTSWNGSLQAVKVDGQYAVKRSGRTHYRFALSATLRHAATKQAAPIQNPELFEIEDHPSLAVSAGDVEKALTVLGLPYHVQIMPHMKRAWSIYVMRNGSQSRFFDMISEIQMLNSWPHETATELDLASAEAARVERIRQSRIAASSVCPYAETVPAIPRGDQGASDDWAAVAAQYESEPEPEEEPVSEAVQVQTEEVIEEVSARPVLAALVVKLDDDVSEEELASMTAAERELDRRERIKARAAEIYQMVPEYMLDRLRTVYLRESDYIDEQNERREREMMKYLDY